MRNRKPAKIPTPPPTRPIGAGDNSGLKAKPLAAFARRAESIEAEIAALNKDKSEIFKEAKSEGFNPLMIKQVLRRRKKDPEALAQNDAELDLYEATINAELGPPEPKDAD